MSVAKVPFAASAAVAKGALAAFGIARRLVLSPA
jgi:hypothetical protein